MSDYTGKILGVVNNAFTGELQLTVSIDQKETICSEYDSLKDKKLKISLSQFRKHRSLDANAMLWGCLQQIAVALRCDKWEVYLQMLRRYGKFDVISIKAEAFDRFKESWRECEKIGEDNGMIELLCYYGSSTMDSKEFSVLLDGVISEMKEMGLTPPPSEEMRRAIEQVEINRAG